MRWLVRCCGGAPVDAHLHSRGTVRLHGAYCLLPPSLRRTLTFDDVSGPCPCPQCPPQRGADNHLQRHVGQYNRTSRGYTKTTTLCCCRYLGTRVSDNRGPLTPPRIVRASACSAITMDAALDMGHSWRLQGSSRRIVGLHVNVEDRVRHGS